MMSMPKRYFIRKFIRKTLFIVAWFTFWIFCYFYYVNSDVLFTPNANNLLVYVAVVVIIIFPFITTSYVQFIFSKTIDGIIIDKKMKYVYNFKGILRFFRQVKLVDIVEVYMRADNGKIIIRKFYDDIIINADYYNIGDKVRLHKGINYFENLDNTDDKHIMCIVCGHISNMEKTKCYNCGNKLYKGDLNVK